MDGFGGDLSVSVALVDGNGNSFVEKSEEAFNDDGFVVATKGWVARELEGRAHLLEMEEEGGAGIRGDKEAKTNTEEDFFHEDFGNGGGVGAG